MLTLPVGVQRWRVRRRWVGRAGEAATSRPAGGHRRAAGARLSLGQLQPQADRPAHPHLYVTLAEAVAARDEFEAQQGAAYAAAAGAVEPALAGTATGRKQRRGYATLNRPPVDLRAVLLSGGVRDRPWPQAVSPTASSALLVIASTSAPAARFSYLLVAAALLCAERDASILRSQSVRCSSRL